MKLIVGLGNPGREYENTRHNMGFITIDRFADKYNVKIDKKKFNGLYTDLNINGEKVILLKPQSYMNLSGEVVRRFVDFYKINVADILIISDDLDLEFGTFKLKGQGSSGGHNGLKNIELYLATREYKRLKLGISNNKGIDTKDYVLGKFSSEEVKVIDNLEKTLVELLDEYLKLDFNGLMNKYNSKNR